MGRGAGPPRACFLPGWVPLPCSTGTGNGRLARGSNRGGNGLQVRDLVQETGFRDAGRDKNEGSPPSKVFRMLLGPQVQGQRVSWQHQLEKDVFLEGFLQ